MSEIGIEGLQDVVSVSIHKETVAYIRVYLYVWIYSLSTHQAAFIQAAVFRDQTSTPEMFGSVPNEMS